MHYDRLVLNGHPGTPLIEECHYRGVESLSVTGRAPPRSCAPIWLTPSQPGGSLTEKKVRRALSGVKFWVHQMALKGIEVELQPTAVGPQPTAVGCKRRRLACD